jgi:hypothetical protein
LMMFIPRDDVDVCFFVENGVQRWCRCFEETELYQPLRLMILKRTTARIIVCTHFDGIEVGRRVDEVPMDVRV